MTVRKEIGKHKTNVAGEWKVGDILLDKIYKRSFICKIDSILNEKYKIYNFLHRQLEYGTYNISELKSWYINITEMQRALGRV